MEIILLGNIHPNPTKKREHFRFENNILSNKDLCHIDSDGYFINFTYLNGIVISILAHNPYVEYDYEITVEEKIKQIQNYLELGWEYSKFPPFKVVDF